MPRLAGTLMIVWASGCWTSSKPTTPVEPPPADAAIASPRRAPPPPLDETEVLMAKMSEFRDAICQCTTTACAQQVSDDMTKWSQEQARDQHEPPKLSDDQIKRATAIGEEMGKCMMKAMSPPPPPTP